jgi:hypothetical protein
MYELKRWALCFRLKKLLSESSQEKGALFESFYKNLRISSIKYVFHVGEYDAEEKNSFFVTIPTGYLHQR